MGKTITTYLVEDNFYGPKIIEIGNWSGKAIYTPTPYMPKLLHDRKDDLNKPGIYFLKSSSLKPIYSEKIYIGEGERVINRLTKHLTDPTKEFDECVTFFSTNQTLTKAHVKYLESRCIKIVKDLDSAELENKQKTEFLPTLPEYDVSDMEYFLEQIKIIVPLVGYNCFKPNIIDTQESNNLQQFINNNKNNVYYITRNEISACLVKTENAFIVLNGSTCRKTHNNSIEKSRIGLRQKLIDSRKLKDIGNVYIFDKDVMFNSTSEAASVILGAQTSGPKTWKDVNGKTYAENIKNELE